MSRPARAEGLGHRHRFHAPGAFGVLFRQARKIRGTWLVVHAMDRGPAETARIGVATSRRAASTAVARNRLKRWVREAFRRHRLMGRPMDVVVSFREGVAGQRREAVVREIERLFDEADRMAGH